VGNAGIVPGDAADGGAEGGVHERAGLAAVANLMGTDEEPAQTELPTEPAAPVPLPDGEKNPLLVNRPC